MDKDEEQIARDKAAIEAMKNAKANMTTALDRIGLLERTLGSAIAALSRAKDDISPKVYCYKLDNQNQRTVHSRIDSEITEFRKVL